MDRFAFTINRGYFDPGARTTYGQWKTVLKVVNRPAIKYFRADRTFVTDIRPVRLSWKTTGAAKLEIPGIGDVTNRTWIDVPIQRDTLFTLVLTPDLGPPVRKELRVEVSKEPPRIEYFSTSSACVREGAEVEIRWKVHGASQVHISPVLGSLPLEGRAKVRVGGECTLTLTARSPFGASATKVLALAVVRLSPLQPAPAGKASAPATRLDPHRIVQLTAIRP